MELEIRQWMMNLYTFPIVINNITTFVDLSYMTTSFESKCITTTQRFEPALYKI